MAWSMRGRRFSRLGADDLRRTVAQLVGLEGDSDGRPGHVSPSTTVGAGTVSR